MAFSKKIILPLILFFGFIALFVHNLSRSVYGGDVGDFITASFVRGVAHPPGYPLFTILGYLLTRLSFFRQSPAFQVGLISVFAGAAGVVICYLFIKYLTKKPLLGLLTALMLGFSFPYWFYSEIAEAFALNSFFALLLFYLAVRFRKERKIWQLVLFLFATGLSLANHQTIVLIFPALFLLVAQSIWHVVRKSPRLIGIFVLSFLAGLLPYLYVPWASSFNPPVNWDSVHDLPSFLQLVLRQDYGTFRAGTFDSPTFLQRIIIVKTYLQYLLVQVTIPTFTLSIVGMGVVWKKDKVLFLAFFVAFLLAGPCFIAYAGFPIINSFLLGVYERFFLLSEVMLLFFFPFGLLFFSEILAKLLPKKNYEVLFQIVFFMIPLALLMYNFPKTDLSQVTIGDTYAYDLLSSLPKDTVLVASGDSLVFNAWYVHFAKHVRPDVLIYNIGGGATEPYIVDRLKSYKNTKHADALLKVLIDIKRARPVYSVMLLQPSTGPHVFWVPMGLSYKLYLTNDALPTHDEYQKENNSLWQSLHLPTKEEEQLKAFHNLTIQGFPLAYSDALIATGTYFYTQYKDADAAFYYYSKAKDVAPENPRAYETLAALYMGQGNHCQDIANSLTIAKSLDPFQELPYFLLYNTYVTCLKNPSAAKGIVGEFEKVFQKSFLDEFKKSFSSTQTSQ